jgi:hypothetical protein
MVMSISMAWSCSGHGDQVGGVQRVALWCRDAEGCRGVRVGLGLPLKIQYGHLNDSCPQGV